MTNLREIYQAIQIYRHDFKGWVPSGFNLESNQKSAPPVAWFRQLYPNYLSDLRVMACPDDPLAETIRLAARDADTSPALADVSSYGMSDFLVSHQDADIGNLDHRPPRRPMDTIMVADMGADVIPSKNLAGPEALDEIFTMRNEGRLLIDDGYDPQDWENSQPWLTDRHLGGINVVTVGGAIRHIPTRELMNETIEAYYPTCSAGDCTICNALMVPHYSFSASSVYWWTGPYPVN